MTPTELRADVPALEETTYMNFGAHGPSPQHVVEAAKEFLETHEYVSPASTGPYETAFDTYDRSREVVAEFVGAQADEIALTESTTAGINAIAGAIDWEPGDVVVRTDLEHPAGVLPWRRLEQEGVEVRVVGTEDGRIDLDAFADAVAGADLVSVSAITWTHGTKLPVRDLVEITHDAGARALVDAVQVPGQTAMDVSEWGADAVAAAGHKWLLGLWGGGFLYVDQDFADQLEPRTVGYRSVDEPGSPDIGFKRGAPRFEVGSASPVPHVALAEAIRGIQRVGIDRIEARIERLTNRLKRGIPDEHLLSPRTFESGLVAIDVDDPKAVVEQLADEGIIVRAIPLIGALRVSVHAVNTKDEIDALLDALPVTKPA
ncbi:aminotransferase class V-fold PLP-dependent enzyme [Haladaptatus sp. NG-SE-30]